MAARAETRPSPPGSAAGSRAGSTTVDHKRIGILYIVTASLFFVAGGLLALLIRTQLAQPNADFLTRDALQRAPHDARDDDDLPRRRPVLGGFANFLVPLMIGARDMAFPRLNALSYWLFLFGGIVLCSGSSPSGGAARAGWTSYPPLSVLTSGNGQDLWILSLHILTVSSLAGAINFIVTIHNMRTPGMTWMRLPLFVWSIDGLRVAAGASSCRRCRRG